ncbi:MAG TPA: dihydroorotate dehydrogenase [Actinobacteria bacterium]|nr:dihydroorotate dehydrogenase [Actinomycetota bacterium]
MDLSVDLAGIKMKNPVMVASGTFAYGREYSEILDLSKLGAVVTKAITLKERKGNPPPRICETPSGILNSIGLQNKGVVRFLREDLPFLRGFDVPVIVNVAGDDIGEYVTVSRKLSEAKVDGVELNISCPNVARGGIIFGTDAAAVAEVVSAVREAIDVPLIVKLSPNVTDITEMASRAVDAGADVLSLINTVVGMAIDTDSFKPELATITGGLSGPAIRPIAVRMVWQVAQAVEVPIIGMGGIVKVRDAVEFLLAGATAIAVGTANFMNPSAALEIIEGLEGFLRGKEYRSIREIVGRVRM